MYKLLPNSFLKVMLIMMVNQIFNSKKGVNKMFEKCSGIRNKILRMILMLLIVLLCSGLNITTAKAGATGYAYNWDDFRKFCEDTNYTEIIIMQDLWINEGNPTAYVKGDKTIKSDSGSHWIYCNLNESVNHCADIIDVAASSYGNVTIQNVNIDGYNGSYYDSKPVNSNLELQSGIGYAGNIINLHRNSELKLENVYICKAYLSGIYANQGTLKLNKCTIENCLGQGIYSVNTYIYLDNNTQIKNNYFNGILISGSLYAEINNSNTL